MTVNYVRIPIELFKLPAQGLYKTSILALIYNFDGRGLKLSNSKLAEVFSTNKRTVEKAIASLKKQGLITDTGTNNYNRCLVLTTVKLAGSSTALLAGNKPLQSTVKLAAKYRKTYRRTTVKLTDHKERKKIKKAQTARTAQKPVCDSGAFDRFWMAYPKKQGKVAAQRAWAKLKPGAGLAGLIIASVTRRRESRDWQKENGRYVPLPTTYLNGRRWEDETPELKQADDGYDGPGYHGDVVGITHDATDEDIARLRAAGVDI